MKGAEAAYSARDFRLALTGYQRALTLDPGLYWAAVFSGDAYLALTQIDSAYVWYARATQINPNSETGWRYWSDVLLKHEGVDEAREKAIESIVAEPFNRLARQALVAWARKTGGLITPPQVDLPAQPPAGAPSSARIAYDSVRRAWRGDGRTMAAPFVAQYPTEKEYRHSLTEEKLALQAAYRAAGDDPATINLRRLDDAGMLEAYIFFGRADAGIAADYETWRRDHRDALKRYWSEFVIGGRLAR